MTIPHNKSLILMRDLHIYEIITNCKLACARIQIRYKNFSFLTVAMCTGQVAIAKTMIDQIKWSQ